MKKIVCYFKGHARGYTKYLGDKIWHIKCKRCGYTIEYYSLCARLIGIEIKFGFDGS